MTRQEQIIAELKHQLAEAETGDMDCYFSVNIRSRIPTVTCIPPEATNETQAGAFREHLYAIADIFREIYTP